MLVNEDVNALAKWAQYLLSNNDALDVYRASSLTIEELKSVDPDVLVLGSTSMWSDDEYPEALMSHLADRSTQVLVIMAWAKLIDLERAVQFGADDVLAPPFSREEFLRRIAALLAT